VIVSRRFPPLDGHSRKDRSRDRTCLGYLRTRYEILPAGVADNRPLRHHNSVARVSGCRGYAAGPPPTLVAACHFSIRVHNENGALVRESRTATPFGEVPPGVLIRHLCYGIAIVHLSDYQDNYPLLV
jgi:hypothetical protein